MNDKYKSLLIAFVFAAILLTACGTSQQAPASAGGNTASGAASAQVGFSRDVLPLLQSRCAGCHGGSQGRAGFSVDSYSTVMAGSANGPVIVPGNPDNSKLIQLVQQGIMPKVGPKLTPDELQILVDWVKQGAQDN
jgi:mono/diheme cytochrome c family protein